MAHNHVVELPKFVWIIKIIQLVLAVITLGLAAYNVSVLSNSASDLTLFTALFTIIIIVYYLVALHATPAAYNWVALLVLESLAVVFWLCSFAVLAAFLAAADSFTYYYYYPYYKRDANTLVKRDLAQTYGGVYEASLAFSVIEFVLYCVTLTYIGIGIHRHQTQGLPMVAGAHTKTGGHTTTGAQQPVEMTSTAPAQKPGHVDAQTQPQYSQPATQAVPHGEQAASHHQPQYTNTSTAPYPDT